MELVKSLDTELDEEDISIYPPFAKKYNDLVELGLALKLTNTLSLLFVLLAE